MLNPDPKQAREFGHYFALSQAGLEMVAPLLIGVWLDYQFGWSPWGAIVGMALGFIGGTAHLIVMAKRIEERRKKQQDDERR
jgi:ATP synthase protein I